MNPPSPKNSDDTPVPGKGLEPIKKSTLRKKNDEVPKAPHSAPRRKPANNPGRADAKALISITEPENALEKTSLEQLPDNMREACVRAGWQGLMPVQAMALPYLVKQRDLMIQSRTGSGKTGTYLLPMISSLSVQNAVPQALVLTPTRELALQVEKEANTLFGPRGLSVAALYGGVGYNRQMDALRRGAQVIIGTPGRVLDHLLRRTLNLEELRLLVFDEADRMLSIGFYPDMKEIQSYLPHKHVPSCLLSATFPPHVLKLAGEFMREPAMLSLSHSQVHVAEVQHSFCECKTMDKDRALVRILETENPSSAIIFCNTKANVHFVTAVLQGFGYNADEISADLSQARREEVMRRVRDGSLRYLVATDVAARGIDIADLSHVILYEPPDDRESYIHRAGRTGRAGAAGAVISLVDVMQKMELERIARFYKINLVHRPTPTDNDVAKAVSERLIAMLEAKSRDLTSMESERLRRFSGLASSMAAEEEQNMLLAMLLDDFYQKSMNGIPSARPQAKTFQRPERAKRSGGDRRSDREEKAGRAGGGRKFGGRSRNPGKSGRGRESSGDSR